MAWLADPAGRVLHIPDVGVILQKDDHGTYLSCLCDRVRFRVGDPADVRSPWVWEPEQRPVCKHCKRTALRIAERLTAQADGRDGIASNEGDG